jgi:hypothetical protein
MDFLRTRAIPALSALLCAHAFAADADCSKLDGRYRYEAVAPVNGQPRYLSYFATGSEARKLTRTDNQGTKPDLSSSQTMRRPKVTHLATSVRVAYAPKSTLFHFLDAEGHELAAAAIGKPNPWTCRDGQLTRSTERTSGLGNAIRTERVEEVLERNAAGELVHRETATVVEGGKGKRVTEARFAAIR